VCELLSSFSKVYCGEWKAIKGGMATSKDLAKQLAVQAARRVKKKPMVPLKPQKTEKPGEIFLYCILIGRSQIPQV
jgi:hypothetical protein